MRYATGEISFVILKGPYLFGATVVWSSDVGAASGLLLARPGPLCDIVTGYFPIV